MSGCRNPEPNEVTEAVMFKFPAGVCTVRSRRPAARYLFGCGCCNVGGQLERRMSRGWTVVGESAAMMTNWSKDL